PARPEPGTAPPVPGRPGRGRPAAAARRPARLVSAPAKSEPTPAPGSSPYPALSRERSRADARRLGRSAATSLANGPGPPRDPVAGLGVCSDLTGADDEGRDVFHGQRLRDYGGPFQAFADGFELGLLLHSRSPRRWG